MQAAWGRAPRKCGLITLLEALSSAATCTTRATHDGAGAGVTWCAREVRGAGSLRASGSTALPIKDRVVEKVEGGAWCAADADDTGRDARSCMCGVDAVCGVRLGEPNLKTPSGQQALYVGDSADGWTWWSLSRHVYDGLSLLPPCRTVEGGVGGN